MGAGAGCFTRRIYSEIPRIYDHLLLARRGPNASRLSLSMEDLVKQDGVPVRTASSIDLSPFPSATTRRADENRQ